ncbi:MAG TPA: cytochrome C oxidase subunit IV family protein [Opitutales bacterium]|nr:cytochrome C oxidase subunit IV family protein [Opitutales bacterium]
MSESTAKSKFSPASDKTIKDESSRFFTFFNVILTLIGLTFLELIIIILPFHEYVLLTGLIGLSIVKFVLVIWYFMHLRWDQIFLTALFMLGLILASGTVAVLYLLFPAGESVTGSETPAVEQSSP